MISYKDAGVDVGRGDEFIERIKEKVRSTYSARVVAGVGGFAALYDMGDRYLATGTDGVGTKLKLAQILDIHNTIGIDLVAMCVNDILCTGATPLFFLDYLACGKLQLPVAESIIEGIVEGCRQGKLALIGGETAEMPGMYEDDEYDLAGFAVGEVKKEDLIDGQKVKEGDQLVGVASSGIHSNGYSLVRALIDSNERELLRQALTPTKIYVPTVGSVLHLVKGLAHITGGGVENIPRINENFDYHLSHLPSDIPSIFSVLRERSGLAKDELYRTFNMGVGMVVVTDQAQRLIKELEIMGEKCWIMGEVKKGNGQVLL